MLRNGNFEADWGEKESHHCLVFPESGGAHKRDVENIFTPPEWVTWFRHDPGTWDQPEVRDVWKSQDSRRVHGGQKAVLLFTFYRKHDAGFLQQVNVTPGAKLQFTAWAHAWSNHDGEGFDHKDDPTWSEGIGWGYASWPEGEQLVSGDPQQDAKSNFTFWVGIDPKGGTDPFAASIVWSQGWHVYNQYCRQLEVEATAEAGTVTVFLRSRTLWPFKHNDAYWDDAELVTVDGSIPPPEPTPSDNAGTKLGAHVLRTCAGLGDYATARPAVVKLVGDWGLAEQVPDGVLIIGRKHSKEYDAQGQRAAGKTPEEAARQFVDDQRATYQSNPRITYWEGHNEPVWNTADEMAWYAQFEVARMRLMADLGLKCVIGNFATGTPALDLWPYFMDAIVDGIRYEAILGLHEYSCPWIWWMTGRHQVDPDEDQGDEGWTTLRYRKVYRQNFLPDFAIPLVITECGIDGLVKPLPAGAPSETWKGLGDYWREHDGETDKDDYYFRQLVWYDKELQKDDYTVGATVFTWGSYGAPWASFDVAGTPVAEKLTAYTREHPAQPFTYRVSGTPVTPEPDTGGSWYPPRVQYERTYVLLPQYTDPVEAIEWRMAAAIGGAGDLLTMGHSADDAGIGPEARTIIAVNPQEWEGDLYGFFEEHYSGTNYQVLKAGTPWEMAVLLQPAGVENIALGQNWPEWANYDFGEEPGGGSIGGYGCFLTGLAIILRKVYDRRIVPPVLDKILCAARAAFVDDNILVWGQAVKLFPVFDSFTSTNQYRTANQLAELLQNGWEVILRRADGKHFVYLEKVVNGELRIIDTWDGKRKVKQSTDFAGVRAAHVARAAPPPPPRPSFPLMGIHGRGGGEYLAGQGVKGWCLDPVYMNEDPQRLDYTALAEAGVRVVGNLRRGYSNDFPGGQGTIPPPDKWDRFIASAVQTIRDARGVYAFTLFNEINNPREWPVEGYQVTPDDVVTLYNDIYRQVKDLAVKVGPGALDPFYGPGSDCMAWWKHILAGMVGAKIVGLHGYTRGPNPAMIGNLVKFGDEPLTWQYVNFPGCVETFLKELDALFPAVEVVVTEYNHLWLEDELFPEEPTIGWSPTATNVLEAAFDATARLQRVSALICYRWSGDDWRMEDKPKLLEKIVALNK